MTQPAVAEIEHARDLMEANRFEEAYRNYGRQRDPATPMPRN